MYEYDAHTRHARSTQTCFIWYYRRIIFKTMGKESGEFGWEKKRGEFRFGEFFVDNRRKKKKIPTKRKRIPIPSLCSVLLFYSLIFYCCCTYVPSFRTVCTSALLLFTAIDFW